MALAEKSKEEFRAIRKKKGRFPHIDQIYESSCWKKKGDTCVLKAKRLSPAQREAGGGERRESSRGKEGRKGTERGKCKGLWGITWEVQRGKRD